jgi:hypothetical protein
MNSKTTLSLILGGGLIVLLFVLVSLKTIALIEFESGSYNIEIKYSFDFHDNKKEFDLPDFKLDEDWHIEDVIEGDFNNDGDTDVGIYLWKVGNYGYSLPFWENSNDTSYKQHLFIFEEDGSAIWHSSNLPYHNIKTILTDINGDGENELIVLEKPYDKAKTTVAVWKWDEWGFVNLWRSEPGNYDDLQLKLDYAIRVT